MCGTELDENTQFLICKGKIYCTPCSKKSIMEIFDEDEHKFSAKDEFNDKVYLYCGICERVHPLA
jgi:hypothetical protein